MIEGDQIRIESMSEPSLTFQITFLATDEQLYLSYTQRFTAWQQYQCPSLDYTWKFKSGVPISMLFQDKIVVDPTVDVFTIKLYQIIEITSDAGCPLSGVKIQDSYSAIPVLSTNDPSMVC